MTARADSAIRVQTPAALPGFVIPLSMLGLLIGEILYLTIRFDTASLARVPGIWSELIGWAPQYLRFGITVIIVTSFVSGRQFWNVVREHRPPASRLRVSYLLAHALAFGLFTWITATLMSPAFARMPYQSFWAIGWLTTGVATILTWSLGLLSARDWLTAGRAARWGLLVGFSVGSIVWAGSFLVQDLWRPLAASTFAVVQWLLRGLYSDVVSEPARLVLGTPSFKVNIAPECSGYEGIALILAFLGLYLWLSRHTLRFPHALLLLPFGAAAVWILNAVRIAALIVIGTSGWPDVALGGFHSQAGWLTFNAVGLGLVAITTRGRYFATDATAHAAAAPVAADTSTLTAAYLLPFMAVLGTSMITKAFSASFEWLYPLRVLAAAAMLWTFRKHYKDLRWSWSWGAIAIGAVTFVIWLALMPATVHDKDAWPAALRAIGPGWAAFWLICHVAGSVVTVPLAEELAFRGFLPRRLVRPEFQTVPAGHFALVPWLVSSILFGALHGSMWLAGTLAGLLFGLALYRRRALGDAVQAHATTNLLLIFYAVSTGHWSAWS